MLEYINCRLKPSKFERLFFGKTLIDIKPSFQHILSMREQFAKDRKRQRLNSEDLADLLYPDKISDRYLAEPVEQKAAQLPRLAS